MTAPLVFINDDPQHVLRHIHDGLAQLDFRSAAAPSAVPAKDLTTLQDAIATLTSLNDCIKQYSCSPATEHLSSSVDILVQQLLAPPAALFSGFGGSPCKPEQDLAAAGHRHREASAAKLQLLLLLLQHVGRLDLPAASTGTEPPAEETGRERARPKYVVGIVQITEEGNVTAPTAERQAADKRQQLLLHALLVCALYAQQDTTYDPFVISCSSSSSNPVSAGGSSSGRSTSYNAFCAGIVQQGLKLASPWSSAACQHQCRHILQHLAAAAVWQDTISHEEEEAEEQQQQQHSRFKVQISTHQQQQQHSWQELVSCMLPQLLDCLRDTVMAQHRHAKAQEKGEIGPYNGPDTFQRCLAARQLAWIAQHLQQQQQQQQQVGLLLPLLLAATDDPSPAVQQYGQAGLGWLGLTGSALSLECHRLLLRDVSRRLVVGCEQGCWETAMPAATSITMATEGKNIRAAGYHELLQELLTEALRNAQKPQQRLIFMGCVGRLVPCMNLYIVRHLAQLMPLLLEWTHAYDEASVLAALQTLGRVVQHAWPRMGAHARVLWDHLVEVASAAEERHWVNTGQRQRLQDGSDSVQEAVEQQQLNSPIMEAAVAVGRLLVQCGGETFTGHLSRLV